MIEANIHFLLRNAMCIMIVVVYNGILSMSYGNNLQVQNVKLTNKDSDSQTTEIQFDLFWENSWRIDWGINNWDAAWVMAKYRLCLGGSPVGDWGHCKISTNSGDHSPPAGYTIDPSNDGVGIFFYRDTVGTGTVNATNVRLLWDYSANGISDQAEVEVEVYGVEMVYIPQDSFYVGDGQFAWYHGSFYTYPSSSTPYHITSEDAINVGSTAGYLYHSGNGISYGGGDRNGPIPAEFPKGYNAFYIMKYEVTQGQYAHYLNSLPGTAHANIMKPAFTNDRQSITGTWPSFTAAAPNRACNWLDWDRVKSYTDWAGLRFVTEFEWEKAARGPAYPQPYDYPWGNDLVGSNEYGLVNDGTDSARTDTMNSTVGNMNYEHSGSAATEGPWRVGIFANDTTNKMESGGSYYGVMDMSGNVMECVVTYGNANRRAYTGSHGDGLLDPSTSNATNTDWPTNAAYKGGSWKDKALYGTISNRFYAFETTNWDYGHLGIRAGRSAP